jgi:hypothetical protein
VTCSCYLITECASPHSDPLKRLDYKIRKVGRDLQRWRAKRVGSIRDQILVANEVILRLDAAQDWRPLSPVVIELRRGLKRRLLGLASLERTIARQRARVAAIKDGDATTQFFRINASVRQRRNHIACLRDGDVAAVEQEEKEELATNFFLQLLGLAAPREHDISLASMGCLPSILPTWRLSSRRMECGPLSRRCRRTNRPGLTV